MGNYTSGQHIGQQAVRALLRHLDLRGNLSQTNYLCQINGLGYNMRSDETLCYKRAID